MSDPSAPSSGPPRPLDSLLATLKRTYAPTTPVAGTAPVDSLGRYLASDVRALRPMPPADNSAMDGYALAAASLNPDRETTLPVTGHIAAGQALDGPLPAHATARIFTGAPLPDGADSVAIQEDVRRIGEDAVFPAGLRPGANVRRKGEDFETGDTVLSTGQRIGPAHLALLIAAGVTTVSTHRPPRVAVMSTGNELTAEAGPLKAWEVPDSNRPMLIALCRALGAETIDLGAIPDDPEAVTAALKNGATRADAVLTSGGVSVGEHDHVKAAVDALGRIDAWKVAMKPGKPVALGRIGTADRDAVFIGLPGNPVSSFVTFRLFARPILLRLAGAPAGVFDLDPIRAELTETIVRKPGRREFRRAVLTHRPGALPQISPLTGQGSHMMRALGAANALVDVPGDAERIAAGTAVDALLLEGPP